MIDNSHKFKSKSEKWAYHEGWVDGMKNSALIREKLDKRFERDVRKKLNEK